MNPYSATERSHRMTQPESSRMVSKYNARNDEARSNSLRNKQSQHRYRTHENFPNDGLQTVYHPSTHVQPRYPYSETRPSESTYRDKPLKRKRTIDYDDVDAITTNTNTQKKPGELPTELKARCQNSTELTLKSCDTDTWFFWETHGSRYKLYSEDLAYCKVVSVLPAKFRSTVEMPKPKRVRKSGNNTSKSLQQTEITAYQEIPYEDYQGSTFSPEAIDSQNSPRPVTNNLHPIDGDFFCALQPTPTLPTLAPKGRSRKKAGATSRSNKRTKRVKARKSFAGFLPRDHPLPCDWADIAPEEFVRHYPNHLQGEVLRRYSERRMRDTFISKHLHWYAKSQLAKDANFLRKWMIVEDRIVEEERIEGKRLHGLGIVVGDYYHPAPNWYTGPEEPANNSELPTPPRSSSSGEKPEQETCFNGTESPYNKPQQQDSPAQDTSALISGYPMQHSSLQSSNMASHATRHAEQFLDHYRDAGLDWKHFKSLQYVSPERALTVIEEQYSSYLQQAQDTTSPESAEPAQSFAQQTTWPTDNIPEASTFLPPPSWMDSTNAPSSQPSNEYGYGNDSFMNDGTFGQLPLSSYDPSNDWTLLPQPQTVPEGSIDPRLIESFPPSNDISFSQYLQGNGGF